MLTHAKSTGAFALAVLAGATFAGAAYAQSPSINITDQKLTHNTVTIADVNLPKNGFIAIHPTDAGGKMSNKIVGYAAVKAGDHKGMKVHLTGTHKAGERLWAVAHQNTGNFGIGAPNKDNIGAPFMQAGKTVDEPFKTL